MEAHTYSSPEITLSSQPRIPILAADALSPEARTRRICELLAKAVLNDWSRQVVAAPRAPMRSLSPADGSINSQRILTYLGLVGSATSTTIQQTLGLSKMQVYRAIRPLVTTGRLTFTGQSRRTAYSLSPSEVRKAELN